MVTLLRRPLMRPLLALLAVGPLVGPLRAAPLAAQQRVEILVAATTDVHGRLRGWDYYANSPDSTRGLARAATIVDSLRRAADGRVVLVDAGDLLQGNALTDVVARVDRAAPHPVIAAMNAMRYDAAAVGNHEFNYGMRTLDRAVQQARFPFLAANTERLDGGRPFQATTIIRRKGVRIAIVGATTPGAMVWDRDNLRGHLKVNDIVQALQVEVMAARTQADVVVLVAHSGIGGESSYDAARTGLGEENALARVAYEVEGIDLIVVGHSHRELADSTINGVLFMQPRNWATSVAVATISLEKQDGRWQVTGKRGQLVQARGHAEHPAVVAATARAHEAALRHSNEVIGRTTVAWRSDSARLKDTPILDLVQMVQMRAAKADLSIASAFSLDATLAPGEVSVRQIAQLYPYDNSLRAVRLSGRQVREFLEHSARYWVVEPDGRGGVRARPDPRVAGYNYDILAGAEYVIDLNRPVGERVTSLRINGRSMESTDSFTVAVNNYRAGGAGGYTMIARAPVVFETQTEVRDLLIDEVRRRGSIEPADVFTQNWSLVQPRRTLRVIALNDFHGGLEKRPDGTAGNRGGAAELAALIARAKAECTRNCIPVVLHGGDLFQGTPASNLAYGRTIVPVLRAFGIAAGALGNHEFDWGQDTLRARMAELGAPILGANVTYVDGRDVPWIPDDTLLTLDGVRVGVVGVADPATPRTTMPRHVADLRFADPAPVITAHAASLRARGAQVVIVVAHIGGFCDRNNADSCNGEIFEIAKALPPGAVDAIVSGHTHSPVNTIVNGIPIVQARSSGRALGVLDLPLGGGPPSRPQVWSVTSDSIRPDVEVAAFVKQATDAVADRIAAPVVELAERLPREGNQYALGNLIADAQRLAGKGDIGVMNNGGIRTEMRAGRVSWGDLYEIQPFGNRLVAVTIDGAALRRYLEALVDGNGIRYHVSGVRIEYDSAAARGARLRKVTLGDGSSIDDRRRYRVIMTDFMASGGDGAQLARDATVEELNRLDLDVLVDHLRASPGGRFTPSAALKAPRITVVR